MKTEIKYNITIEVTREQYLKIVKDLPGCIAHREQSGEYYIKALIMKFKNNIEQILENIK